MSDTKLSNNKLPDSNVGECNSGKWDFFKVITIEEIVIFDSLDTLSDYSIIFIHWVPSKAFGVILGEGILSFESRL